MKAGEKGDEAYYVGFSDAPGMRRAVLETARSVVRTVQLHSRVRDIQDEKLKLRTDLAHIVHEIRDELHKLEERLPKRDTPIPASPITRATPVRRVADHRLDKIEEALSEIEQRIRSV